MNTSSTRFELTSGRVALAVGLMMALGAAPGQAAVVSGSTGADGALSPTVNTEIQLPPSGVLNYTTVNIPSGVTVKFKKNAANTPVFILATGNVSIAGVIDLRGGDGKPTGIQGDGALADDGLPGLGGPGGYDGGSGGREDATLRAEVIGGGTGKGPGGGPGAVDAGSGCTAAGYWRSVGVGGGHVTATYPRSGTLNGCPLSGITRIGKPYGSALLQPLIGGSGGGGGRGGATYAGPGGGGGGGAILIATSAVLALAGSISVEGGDGGDRGDGDWPGGGSGGAIRLVATRIEGSGTLNASGGCITVNNVRRQNCGTGADGSNAQSGGASGRIRFEAESIGFNGTQTPTATTDSPGPIFIADAPALRIASVAGQAVPVNPSGDADIALPAGTTPIDVTFQTTNVPTGNTVLLRVVPTYGQPIEVLSPAITGSTAAGTASVTVTLPAGPSTLQATTTYTVVVAGDIDLSRFAQNEVVEKVEVTVPMVGAAQARLITRTGKSYGVPYDVLRAAGFRG